jgi:hypothetical protein
MKSCLTDTQARFPADQNGRGSTCLELKFAKQYRAQARKSPVRGLPMPASTGILCPIHRDNLDRHHSIRAFRDRD